MNASVPPAAHGSADIMEVAADRGAEHDTAHTAGWLVEAAREGRRGVSRY